MSGHEPAPAGGASSAHGGDDPDALPVHPWRRPGGGPPISARTAILLVALVFLAGVAVGFLLAQTA